MMDEYNFDLGKEGPYKGWERSGPDVCLEN